MENCSNEMQIKHTSQIAKLETDMKNVKDRIDDLTIIKDAVVETKTYVKILSKSQEEQSKINQEFSTTLKSINKNLDILNMETIETKNEIKGTNKRIDTLENKIIDIDEKSKVDILKILKDWTPKLLVTGIAFYILQLVGIIK